MIRAFIQPCLHQDLHVCREFMELPPSSKAAHVVRTQKVYLIHEEYRDYREFGLMLKVLIAYLSIKNA